MDFDVKEPMDYLLFGVEPLKIKKIVFIWHGWNNL